MQRIKLLVLLGLASLQLTVFVAAQGPKHPEVKRPTEKKSREDPARGRARTRDRVDAWDRRQDRTGETRSVETKTAARRRVEKERRWDKQTAVESRSSQQAKLREHIFRGRINGRGRPVGFHYEGRGGRPADGIKVVEGSRSKPDKNGVYKAEIEAGGARKRYNTFFPRSWSRAEVEKAVDEAYANRVNTGKAPNDFRGKTSSGVTIGMKVNKDGVMKTAYPIYESVSEKFREVSH